VFQAIESDIKEANKLSSAYSGMMKEIMQAAEEGKQKRTMADMRTIATAIEALATDHDKYDMVSFVGPMPPGDPLRFETLRRVSYKELTHALRPTYVRSLPQYDGWGTEFDVRQDWQQTTYSLRSAAGDRRFDSDVYAFSTTRTFDEDIVLSEGNFIQYPEGICNQ
jgi:general secretion pathway protein G